MSTNSSAFVVAQLNNSLEFNNEQNSDFFFASDGECPSSFIYVFLLVFCIGLCINLLECLILLFSKRNGVLAIILQLTVADIVLFPVSLLEVHSTSYQTWKWDSSICMLHKGTEIFANSLVIYLLVCLNCHVITYWNLHNLELVKNNRNPLTSFSESSSSECLVVTSGEARSLGINYRKRRNDVPVLFPIIAVWTLCLSVSMPSYFLSSTVETNEQVLCVIVQNDYGKIVHTLLLLFCVSTPCLILVLSLVMLVRNLVKYSKEDVLTKQYEELKTLVVASILLSLLYISTSYQRHYSTLSITIKEFFIFHKNYYNNYFNVYLVMLHYCGAILRGGTYYFLVPDVRRVVTEKLNFGYRA